MPFLLGLLKGGLFGGGIANLGFALNSNNGDGTSTNTNIVTVITTLLITSYRSGLNLTHTTTSLTEGMVLTIVLKTLALTKNHACSSNEPVFSVFVVLQ